MVAGAKRRTSVVYTIADQAVFDLDQVCGGIRRQIAGIGSALQAVAPELSPAAQRFVATKMQVRAPARSGAGSSGTRPARCARLGDALM